MNNCQPTKGENLTPRELEVLRLICEGLQNKEVAAKLGVGTRTVETHRERICHKIFRRPAGWSPILLFRRAIELGYVEAPVCTPETSGVDVFQVHTPDADVYRTAMFRVAFGGVIVRADGPDPIPTFVGRHWESVQLEMTHLWRLWSDKVKSHVFPSIRKIDVNPKL